MGYHSLPSQLGSLSICACDKAVANSLWRCTVLPSPLKIKIISLLVKWYHNYLISCNWLKVKILKCTPKQILAPLATTFTYAELYFSVLLFKCIMPFGTKWERSNTSTRQLKILNHLHVLELLNFHILK